MTQSQFKDRYRRHDAALLTKHAKDVVISPALGELELNVVTTYAFDVDSLRLAQRTNSARENAHQTMPAMRLYRAGTGGASARRPGPVSEV